MTNYSAKHWAIKAEKSAKDAERYASGIDLSNYATKSDLQSVRNEFEEEDVSIKNKINTLEDLIESNTSEINQQIANKANKDLSDVSQSGKETVVGWGMPDYSAGVTLSAGNYPYTAPYDGMLSFCIYVGSAASSGRDLSINGINVGHTKESSSLSVNILMNKGDIASYNAEKTSYGYSTFFPLKGVNNA